MLNSLDFEMGELKYERPENIIGKWEKFWAYFEAELLRVLFLIKFVSIIPENIKME
jgi:hypothetical protein